EKVYDLQMYDNGTPVRDFIPAKNSSGVVGMYDTVNVLFYQNAGTGNFVAGDPVVPTPDAPMDIVCNNGVLKARHQSGLPLGYTLLEYIESSGTQYFDIGVNGNATFIGTAQSTTNSPTTSQVLMANGGAGAGRWFGVQSPGVGTGFAKKWGLGASASASTTIDGTTKVDFEITFSDVDGQYGTVNDQTITRTTSIPTQTDWIAFAGATTPLYGFIGKVWSLKVVQNDVLVRNFVPVKNALNVIGMYDFVSGQFFTNQGTGDFVAGSTVSDPVEIYTDGTVETINVHGKNLFDKAQQSTDYYYNNSGEEASVTYLGVNFVHSAKIPCKPNTQYVLSGTRNLSGDQYYYKITFWDKNGDFISYENPAPVSAGNYVRNITTPNNCYYIAFNSFANDTDVQLEQGSTATDYEPYYDGGTATAEMLLKVGDYQDVQSILDGVVTRKVGVLVLDGTEQIWGSVSQTPDKVTILTNCYTVAVPLGDAPIDKRRVYCTHLNSSDTLPAANARQGYALLGNSGTGTPEPLTNKYAVGLGLTTRFPTIAGLKQWLAQQYNAGTPVIVVYPLSTATTESVAGQTLQVTDGDNVLEITQASLDGLELEAQYQAAVSLTIQEVQDANLDPNVEVTIN
ncbi:MAG: hypothetical protein II453_10970, partial [Alphaproteobacteria bacterium]|nr:hypothetical protein [Alphaproteobacteria bacterium]